jgi:hypothetical protein
VKEQFAPAPVEFNEGKTFVIKIERSFVWWSSDVAVFPTYAFFAVSHFTNII